MRTDRLKPIALLCFLGVLAGCGRVIVDVDGQPPNANGDGTGHSGQGGGAAVDAPKRKAKVSSHWSHVCALDVEGALSCWGSSFSGELGLGFTAQGRETTPRRVDAGHKYKDIYAGVGSTCGVRDDGSLWCWGRNMGGALATGDRKDRSSPVRVGDGADYVQVAVGSGFACGVRAGGGMDCWGGQDYGAALDGPFDTSVLTSPVPIPGAWVSVSSHWYYTLAVRADGSVWAAMNDGDFKEVRTTPTSRVSSGPVDVVFVDQAGALGRLQGEALEVATPLGEGFGGDVSTSYHTCAIALDGAMFCGAEQGLGGLVQVGDGRAWTSVATETAFSCGTQSDGSLWCWGQLRDDHGDVVLDYGTEPSRVNL